MKIGPYELLDLIGKGGMGSVHRCRHDATGRILAIKVMAADLVSDPTHRKRFERECRTAVRLRHPNIVEGVDFGVERGVPYLVMEYVEGENLADLVRRHGPLPERHVIRLGGQIGAALDAAHRRRLIHRDVKPENVMVDGAGQAKLADLGLIKCLRAGGGLTLPGTSIGTVAYMAPEQFGDASEVDARSDVFGLASTLYFALTGAPPFPDKGLMAALAKKLGNEFVPPRTRSPAVSGMVNATICLALDAKKELRPATCRAFMKMMKAKLKDTRPVRPVRPAARPPVLTDADRRNAKRFPTNIRAWCSPARLGERRWEAAVRDVSFTGARLEAARRFEPGTVLDMKAHDEASGGWATFLVQVRWSCPLAGGQWGLGCTFARRLHEGDLDLFLKHKTATRLMAAAASSADR